MGSRIAQLSIGAVVLVGLAVLLAYTEIISSASNFLSKPELEAAAPTDVPKHSTLTKTSETSAATLSADPRKLILPNTIWMEDPAVNLLWTQLNNATTYFEFGCGGSTWLAMKASTLKNICSVDSSKSWLNKVRQDPLVKAAEKSKRLRLVHADIGKLGDWGFPDDNTSKSKWPAYSGMIQKLKLQPDLVLVDGRFRVACALQTMLSVPTARILMHDFWDRPKYHVVLQFATVLQKAETMVLFEKAATANDAEIKKLLDVYKFDSA